MGYDLTAKNSAAGGFHFGAFSFPVVLEVCNYLFPVVHGGGRWYAVFGVDPRMPRGDTYPAVLSNDGFEVTAEEARIMARFCRNFVAVQRSLPDENRPDDMRGKAEFNRDDVVALMQRAMHGTDPGPWPVKIRADFIDTIERFVEWAEKSEGFAIH